MKYHIEPVCRHRNCVAWTRQKQAEATVKQLEARLDAAYAELRDARQGYVGHLDAMAKAA